MFRFPLPLSSLFVISILFLPTKTFAQTHPTNPFNTNGHNTFSGHLCQAPSSDGKTTLGCTVGGMRVLPHHHWQRCTYSSPLNAMVWEDVSPDEVTNSQPNDNTATKTTEQDKDHDGMNDFTDIFKNGVSDKFTSIGGKKKQPHS